MAEKVRTFKREFKIVESSHGGDDSQIVIRKDLDDYVRKTELIDNLSTKTQQNAFAREIVNAVFKSRIWKNLETRVERLEVGQEELRLGQQGLRSELSELKTKVERLEAGQEELRLGQQGLRSEFSELKTKVDENSGKLDEVLALLKSGK